MARNSDKYMKISIYLEETNKKNNKIIIQLLKKDKHNCIHACHTRKYKYKQ